MLFYYTYFSHTDGLLYIHHLMNVMIAVISDIHGNFPALEAVLEDIPPVDAIICAGDLVGYNPYPNEVINEIKLHGIICIRGNHDRAVIYDDYSNMNEYAALAAIWTRRKLTQENLNYLASLRDSLILNIEGRKIAIHHGAPFDEDYYVFPDYVGEELLEYDEPDVLILGHTHVPFIKRIGERFIINPGSVGQPRDGDPHASYILADLKNMEFELQRVEYDIDEVVEKIKEENLPIFLGERLYYGI